MEGDAGDSMNGLTAADVRNLTGAISQSADRYRATGKNEIAGALEDLLYAINEMQRYNTTQASRPDRVGDECWFRTGGDWQRGILRVWDVGSECSMAIVEDKKTGVAKSTINISFSAEAPK
jgi:hypothetical protein